MTDSYETGATDIEQTNTAKKRLLVSALALFSEKGYAATSIREIIERADVTRPVLYYYFENKEALFRRLVQAQFNEITAYTDEIIASLSGCRDRLRALISKAFERTEKSPLVSTFIFQVCFSPSELGPYLDKDQFVLGRFRRITQIMRDGIDAGELSPGNAETLALAFTGIMDMHIMAKIYQPGAKLTKELGYTLVDLFLMGASDPNWATHAGESTYTFAGPPVRNGL